MNYLIVAGGITLGCWLTHGAITQVVYTSQLEKYLTTLWFGTIFIGGATWGAYQISRDWMYWCGVTGLTLGMFKLMTRYYQ